MKLTCPFCGHHDIVTEHMLTGLFIGERQLEAWFCSDCGWQGPKDDFVPGAKRRM